MTNMYRCIGGCMNNPRHFVETVYPSGIVWIVPGTYPEDPAFDQAGAMAHYSRAHRTHYWLGQYPA